MSTEKNQVPRATGLLVIEVRNSNPNGDPDRESDPRTRAHDGKGIISDVSFKRKLRELVLNKSGPVWTELKSIMTIQDNNKFGIHVDQTTRNQVRSSTTAGEKKVSLAITGTCVYLAARVSKKAIVSYGLVLHSFR
jgi:CRISPR-associated protein Csd2